MKVLILLLQAGQLADNFISWDLVTGEKQQRALKDIQESWPSWDPTKPHFALRAGGREEIPSTVALPLIYTIKVKVMSIIKLPLETLCSQLFTLYISCLSNLIKTVPISQMKKLILCEAELSLEVIEPGFEPQNSG